MTPWSLLESLVGAWEGVGVGEFPTIDTFHYREKLTIRATAKGSLQYEQTTWRIADDGELPSHHELGFIGIDEGSSIVMMSVQGLDRLEALRGDIDGTLLEFALSLTSTALAGDDRMISSWRRWAVSSNQLHYDMGMATRSVPNGSHHLSADLDRVLR